jgi:hypothetical protein
VDKGKSYSRKRVFQDILLLSIYDSPSRPKPQSITFIGYVAKVKMEDEI